MRLTKSALTEINTPAIRRRLMEALGDVAESTIYRYINANDDNLTKAAALKVIREETGLTDAEILEEEKVHMEVVTK
jgi:predicted DNA-binding transcriptional regulator AlpA